MAFRGLYEHSLDSKDRLTVPARFRTAFADGVVLSQSFDTCVWLQTPEAYDKLSADFLAPHSPFSSEARSIRRVFHGNAFDEKLDSAGRVRIPKPLLEHAGLKGACVFVGGGEYLEIWDAEAWATEQAQLKETAPAIAEGLAGTNQ